MTEERTQNIRLIITGGGTGGHLFPGIALAQSMQKSYPGCEVLFIGTERKVDKQGLAGLGFETLSMKGYGIKGKGFTGTLKALVHQPAALWTAAGIIRKFKPDLVFGVGGYVTGPVILAARLLGIPTCIHEQNSIPGMANKILGRIAEKIFVSLPGSEKYFPARKTLLSGNPVRSGIISAAQEQKSAEADKEFTLLVLGGSQGARRLNSLMLEAAEKILSGLASPPGIIHQTGADDEDLVRDKYAELGLKARVSAFFNDMAEIYSKADLIVSRAGATTLAELTVFGKPVILVPFPFAADNHQEINGQYLVDAGAALMFRQSELTGIKLGTEIKQIMENRELLARMARNSGKIAKPEATATITSACMEILKARIPGNTGNILAF